MKICMPLYIFNSIKPKAYQEIVFKYLQVGSPYLRELLINFNDADDKLSVDDVYAFLDDLWNTKELTTSEYNVVHNAYPIGLPGYNYYHRILNHIRTNYTEQTPVNDMLRSIASKFGGVYWNSGGGIMLVSFLVSEVNAVIVSEEYISYNRKTGDMTTDDLLYLNNEDNSSEIFGEMLNLRAS